MHIYNKIHGSYNVFIFQLYSWCGMREPRGEGGETGEGKFVGESFIYEVGTSWQ